MLALNYTGYSSKLINVGVSIDVIIPTYRLNETNLLPILEWEMPPWCSVMYFLVVDNPQAPIPLSIQHLADRGIVQLLINEKNRGASFTRNRGINAGMADWILLLDDDLEVPKNLIKVYAQAVMDFPDETGFIGLVRLPSPHTDFSKAILASGSMDIFSIAERTQSHPWGATANVMLRRSALQGVRFSLLYPKSGGGEDVDLFLRIREKNENRNYKTIPQAVVYHPWWNQGRPEFKKPWRYGLGNSLLGELNPAYAYYDFLNTSETVLLLLPVCCFLWIFHSVWAKPLLFFLAGLLLIEMIASFIQTLKRSPGASPRVLFYVLIIRLVYETGLLWGNLSRFRLQGIGERFHDDAKKNKWAFFRTNTHKIIKWILYPVLAYFVFRRFF